MSKSYIYKVLGNDRYKVIRVDDKKPKGERLAEYIVDLKGGDMMCGCPGFQVKINMLKKGKKIKGTVACKHVKDILAQLASKGGGILDFENPGDYDRLIKEVKKDETI